MRQRDTKVPEKRGGDRQGYPAGQRATLLGRGEDPHRSRCLRGEDSVAQNLFYQWSKESLEAGKKQFAEILPARRTPTRSRSSGLRRVSSRKR